MIIDGDGAKFRDDYFRAGDDGGGQAAQQLRTQVKQHLQQTYPDTSIDNWNLMVFFYANMDGLAKALASRRILPSRTDLQKFASGFGRANSLFSFVDVGYGKDKADHKCQAMLKQMLHISACRHIFFGPCCDNGYLNLLEEYKHDSNFNKKITLFATEPAEPGFIDLGFNIVSFPSVFRSEPLGIPRGHDIGIQPFPPAPLPYSKSADDLSDMTTPSPSGATTHSPAVSNSKSTTLAPHVFASLPNKRTDTGTASDNVTPTPSSWAVAAKISNGPVIDIYTKKAPAPKPKRYALFNASNQRVDERLPQADANAVKSLENKARLQGTNFCNFYHLVGSCDKGENCEYQHEVKPKLTPSERVALWHKSRGIVCSEGLWCEDPYCLSGHHCKNIYNNGVCTWGPKCFFRETHDADAVSCAPCPANRGKSWIWLIDGSWWKRYQLSRYMKMEVGRILPSKRHPTDVDPKTGDLKAAAPPTGCTADVEMVYMIVTDLDNIVPSVLIKLITPYHFNATASLGIPFGIPEDSIRRGGLVSDVT